MPKFGFATEQVQRQIATLSQQQQYSLRVLAMPATELREFLTGELESNPVLEPEGGLLSSCAGNEPMTNEVGGERGPEPYESHRNAQVGQTLQEELLFQLMTGRYTMPLQLGEYIIACLNPNGYLEMSDEAIAKGTGLPIKQITEAIEELQTMEPTGVFAHNLSECLLLQLKVSYPKDRITQRIAAEYLEMAAQGRFGTIAKELHCDTKQIQESFAIIKTLNPKPGSSFFSERADYVVPDIKVTVVDDDVVVSSLTGNGVHINSYYLDRLPLVDSLTHEYLKSEIGRGKYLIKCIEQRRGTLMAVATEAVKRQREFFVKGTPMSPLTMGELAEALELHESTISRTVSGKYLRYSGGTMPLGKLFCGSLSSGGSTQSAKRRIAELVSEEDKKSPLSDEKLAGLLAAEGIDISRRAIAKYRYEMNLPSSQSRKV